jgi:hypothetical protein
MINSYHGSVTETEIIEYVSGLSGVVTLIASEESGAPAAAWGDTFFFYDPEAICRRISDSHLHCRHP